MKWALALGFVGYGAVVFLEAMGLLQYGTDYYLGLYWPTLLIAYAVEQLWKLRRKRGLLIPLLLLLFGAFLLLHNLGLVGFAIIHPFTLIYALFLIYIGMVILGPRNMFRLHVSTPTWRNNRRRGGVVIDMATSDDGETDHEATNGSHDPSRFGQDSEDIDEGEDFKTTVFEGEWKDWKKALKSHFQGSVNTSSFADESDDLGARQSRPPHPPHPPQGARGFRIPYVGEVRYGDDPWHLEPLVIDNLAGSIRINLTTATISTGETPIVVHGGAGEVRIKVPEGVAISAVVEVFGGEVRLFNQRVSGLSLNPLTHCDPEYEQAERKVRIYVKVKFGEVRITRMM